jgi:hypothetical protein
VQWHAMTRVGLTIAENEMLPQWHCPVMRIWDLFYEEPNELVNWRRSPAGAQGTNSGQ